MDYKSNVWKKFSPIVDSLSAIFLLLFIMCSALVSAIQRNHLPDMKVKLTIVSYDHPIQDHTTKKTDVIKTTFNKFNLSKI